MRKLEKSDVVCVLGGGQLGMFFTQAAQQLGFKVMCYTPYKDDPATRYADQIVIAEWGDASAMKKVASSAASITYEFENIPNSVLNKFAELGVLYPPFDLVTAAKDRALEKQMLDALEIPVAKFAVVESYDALVAATKVVGIPSILKTAVDGYDGKGQWRITAETDLRELWVNQVEEARCTLEAAIDLESEISVLVAGDAEGEFVTVGPIHNDHENHILDVSYVPDQIDPALAASAKEYAIRIAKHFKLVGLVCVEYFVDQDGKLMANEIAPRPHNSGHLTMEGFDVSQYQLQALSVAGHALPVPQQIKKVAMANLLGDLWDRGVPDFRAAQVEVESVMPAVKLNIHPYGKTTPRPGRKMGHVTAIADQTERAVAAAKRFRELIRHQHA